ncbi:MAG: response regulator [Bacteroidota bacterium]
MYAGQKKGNQGRNRKPAAYLRILLADDNILEQKIAERMFRVMGYEVDVVSNGHEVVQAVRFKPYDVAIIDEEMPALDACGTAKRIHSLPALWKQPWIVLSTNNADYTFVTDNACGFNDFICKPFDEDVLWQTLARVPLAKTVLPYSEPR